MRRLAVPLAALLAVTRKAALVTVLLALLVAVACVTAQGQSRAAILLTLPSSTRGLALGEAWGAVADDESALFYNPAQLARQRFSSAGGSIQRYIAGTTLGAFAVARRIGRGTAGLGVQMLDYGSEEEVVSSGGEQGTPTGGSVSAQDMSIAAGYGLPLGARGAWRVGAALKWVRQQVASSSGSVLAADVGAAYSAANGWELGAALQHVGPRLTLAAVSAPLPYTWRVSAASPLIRGALGERLSFRAMAEARQSSGAQATGVLATEGSWRVGRDGLALGFRAGYTVRGGDDDRRPLTLGGGITLARITVDYAFEGFEQLGSTHRVGVRIAALPGGP